MSERGVYSQHVDAMLPDDDGVDALRDEDDEVMYDSCNDSVCCAALSYLSNVKVSLTHSLTLSLSPERRRPGRRSNAVR